MKFEADIINFLQTNISTSWITFFQIITMFGSYLGFFISFIIIFVKNKKLSLFFAVTFVLGSLINQFLKFMISRDRPFVTYDYIENYGKEDGSSFPSGHSVCGGMFASFLCYHLFCQCKDRWTRGLGCSAFALMAGLIAFSRMVLGVHYISDVIVGIILGILFAILGIWLYNTSERKTFKTGNNTRR